jgi:hypothetical protein
MVGLREDIIVFAGRRFVRNTRELQRGGPFTIHVARGSR